jgi:16S rRNA (guanine1207-N2)-methyltransferase
MHPTFQLLERHATILSQTTTFWFDAPEDSSLIKAGDKQFSLNHSASNSMSLEENNIETADINVLFYPKAKDRLTWWLNQLMAQLKDHQQIWVIGENNGGIKSLAKHTKDQFECFKVDSARHCALIELRPTVKPENDNPWKNYNPWKSYHYKDITVFSLPGVFSAAKLDKGTELLLASLPHLKGSVLEFGCGAGILTLALAKQDNVIQVTTVDIDALAVRSTIKSAQHNKLDHKIKAVWSAGTSQLNEQKFDFIVTNPPFHQGIKTTYAATEDFFSQAHKWLKPRGRIIWVANDFLSYEPGLQAHFIDIETLDRKKGFKVMQATKK